MDLINFVEDSLWKIWSDIVCLSDMVDHITSNFLKAVFSQILLGPFLDTLTHLRKKGMRFY